MMTTSNGSREASTREITDLLKQGLSAKKDGRLSDAEAIFIKCLQKDISFVPALIELAILYDDQDELSKSIYYYEKALKLDPLHYEVRIHLANCLIRNEQVDRGIQELRDAIEQDENKADGWYYLAIAYFIYLNETEKALAIVHRIIEINPFYISGYTLLGEIQFSRKDIQGAIQSFEKALQIDPENKDAHLALSAIYGNDLKNRHESLKHALLLLESDPTDEMAKHNVEMALKLPAQKSDKPSDQALEEGMAYLYLKKWDLAEHALKRALRLDPSHPQVWKLLQKARGKKNSGS